MRRSLRIFSIVLVALLIGTLIGLPSTATVSAQEGTTDTTSRTVSVSGSGQVNAEPDTAYVTLGVDTQAEEAAAALAQNSEQMQSLVDALKQAGIAAEDIQTQYVRLQPRYSQPDTQGPSASNQEPTLIGYQASNAVEVRVQDLNTLGDLLDTAVQAGSNRIQGIRFEVSDPATFLDQAREMAWNDAMHKAEQLATLAGAELGDAVTINETSASPRPVVREEFARAQAAAVPIEPGTQSIQVDVQVTWQLR